ncbi:MULTISPECIES: NAD(P)/FAD-dependent oxidoreductase [Gordonia]|uniref:FAD-dependent oxidoreductase n=2 Tax=Gordonia TaxID=2053 RepID=A0ABN3H4U4_9ACTN|nr:FAD-dependent oxidoreductase [Gordonia sp. QH-12]KXT57292.1 rubredoxin reductase [Gordonia sp. QH-12]
MTGQTASDAGVVVVGAGTAGVTAAATLRAEGYDGPVTLIGAEPGTPYRRTALSKDLLGADLSESRIALQKPDFWASRGIDIRTRVSVTAIDTAARTVALDDGTRLDYRALVLATGGRPIRPSWLAADVPALRTRDDAIAIRDGLNDSQRLVVIGGGLIGLELAASAAAHGMSATVVEAGGRVASRVMPAVVSDYLQRLHEGNGVRLHLGSAAHSATSERVQLSGGAELAGTVVAAIGASPEVALAAAAGVPTGPAGIVVDSTLATEVPGVFAAGDAAGPPDLRTGRPARGEHWFGATDQGRAVAQSVLAGLRGEPAAPFVEVPRAWTVQYGVNVQMVGWPTAEGEVELDGSIDDADATVRTVVDGELVGAVTIGRAAAARACRSEIAAALVSKV